MDPLYTLSCLLPSGFTSDFQFYDYYIRAAYILLYHLCPTPPVFCSYLIISWIFTAWYHLLYIYLLLFSCVDDTVFNACLWFRFIDIRVLIYARHFAFTSPLAGEFWLPWILMFRFRSLELVDSPSCWSEMCNGSVDHQQTVQKSHPSRPPCSALKFSCYDSESPFVLFIIVYLLIFSYLSILVM